MLQRYNKGVFFLFKTQYLRLFYEDIATGIVTLSGFLHNENLYCCIILTSQQKVNLKMSKLAICVL
jgi:hypothetical protein